jgi:K+-transporting ATPase KdpF subunit
MYLISFIILGVVFAALTVYLAAAFINPEKF